MTKRLTNGETQPKPAPILIRVDEGLIDGETLIDGMSGALEAVRDHLQKKIDVLQNRDRDFADDLQAAKMECGDALRATERLQRDLMSEFAIVKRSITALQTEVDQLRRSQYRK